MRHTNTKCINSAVRNEYRSLYGRIASEGCRDNWVFFVYYVILTSSAYINEKQWRLYLGMIIIIKGVVQNAWRGKDYIIIGEQMGAACASERQVKQNDSVPKMLSLICPRANALALSCYWYFYHKCFCTYIHVTHNYPMFIDIQNS